MVVQQNTAFDSIHKARTWGLYAGGGLRADGGWAGDTIDEHGRPTPDIDNWPSAAGGKGFKPLADWTHDLGLKFGIWTLRGVVPQAIAAKSPVLGSSPPTTIDRIVYDPNTCPRTATEQRWCNCTWDVQGRGAYFS